MTIALGVPVEPELHTPHAWGGDDLLDRLGRGREALVEEVGVVGVDDQSGAMVARTRSRSHAGRSHRIGMTTAPTFQPAKHAIRCSGELRRHTARYSPTSM